MTDLGLNEHHQGILQSYIQFAKYTRGQNLKAVDICFEDVLNSRLLEPTYTKDEVEEILRSLLEVVRGEIETELIGFAHNSVLLLSQLFQQAEKWHLRMNVNLSEIQNRELLECVKAMEAVDLHSHDRKKLQPIDNSDGTIALMRIEVGRLQQENERLDQIVKELEEKMTELSNEKNKIEKDNLAKDKEIDSLTERTDELLKRLDSGETEQTSKTENADSEKILGEYEAVLSEQLTAELETMRQQVLAVQSQLTLAEQELERKFNQTTAYANMKKMIAKKNEQVKNIRKRLLNYEPNYEENEENEDTVD